MDEATKDDATTDDATTVEEAPVASPAQARLDDLALELGALAAETDGVARVQARPGAVEIARQALDGLAAAVASVTARVGTGAGASESAPPPAGRSQPLVTLVVTDDETRVVLDLAVDEAGSGPAVARDVAARLLVHLAEQQLPDPTVDVRIVGVAS
ncbi:hypothetical protein IFT90_14510 [Frigoribacterium sp. CFBP 8766]|uniref:hypothetical protein n=1 Tax=Frigoribacterium sp. CFBP 8766 TaxID=2775273 RepID=UPI0017821AA2|nr:hypothetical protein [Frigoribacterium sp. CFBP 8766]MBD8585768.1 hypothetical protein [Frigoribacterium sp. CFBP 8766]